jgi:DNA-binding NarL/FixJ family response regulator
VLAAANKSRLRGMMEMQDASDVIKEIAEELGLTEKWEAGFRKKLWEEVQEEVREESWEEAAKRLQKYGMEPQQIAEALQLSPGTVFRYLETE